MKSRNADPHKVTSERARLFCSFSVQCWLEDASLPSFPAVVNSLGSGGLRLELESPLRPGQRIRLAVPADAGGKGPDEQAIECAVQSCRKLPGGSRRQADLLVAAPWSELKTTWLAPILRTLAYVEALPSPGTSGGIKPGFQVSPQELAGPYKTNLDENVAQLLQDAHHKVLHRADHTTRIFGDGASEGLSVVERRLMGRLACRYEVVFEVIEGDLAPAPSWHGVVVDLSPAGLALETAQDLCKGTTIRIYPPGGLEFDGSDPVLARVSYGKRLKTSTRLGLVLANNQILSTWLAVALRFLGFSRLHLDQKRRYVRARALRHLPVKLRDGRSPSKPGQVIDLGRGGALLQAAQSYEELEPIELTVGPLGRLPLLHVAGQVVESRPKPGSTEWLIRVKFLDPESTSAEGQARLEKYVLELLRAHSLAP